MSEMKTSKVKGSISLVNMSDIVKTAGVGIKNTEVYYATSNSGTVPPELEDASLKTELNGEIITLSFASLGTSFLLEDEVLFGYQNGKKIPLILENGNIIGTKGWQLGIIPEVAPGDYLWSKTVYYFTNGNISTTYGVSRQGEQGPQGIPGPQAAMYKLASNYSEILGFVQKGEKPSEDEVVFSPNKISFFVLQENAQKVNTKVKLIKDNFRIQLYVPKTGEEPQDVRNDCFDLNENGDECIINLEPNSTFRTNYPLTEKYEVIIIYSYTLETEEETFYLTNYVNIRYGLTKDMAQFSLEANGIVQAVRNSKMEFTADGLKIYNGGFEIVKKEQDNPEEIQLLNFDEIGNLKVSVIIDALGGTIGGLNIESDRLYSKAKIKIDDPDDSNNKIETDNPAIVINGNNGEIIADQITLGTGAKIDNYIQLGTDAYIRNPDINNGVFLESKNLSVSNEGKMKIGKIELYGGTNKGEDAYIRDIGDKWRIQGDGKAIFNDVYANNVHLQDTILEIGTVQSLGSLMLFKDSWTTERIEVVEGKSHFIISGITNLVADDWIYTPEGPFKVSSVEYSDLNSTRIALYKLYPKTEEEIVFTKLGKPYEVLQTTDLVQEEKTTELNSDGFIISILGSALATDINRSFASGNSLTISDFVEKYDNLTYRKRLVLGQLEGVEFEDGIQCSGLGLYADNVFLKGSLTTKTGKNSYAGINTNASVKAKSGQLGGDETEIVFWAGANSSSAEDIQKAPFFITAGGSLYAQKGIFKGEIRAADIYAAKIHGINNDGDASSLIVYDDSNGVIFMEHATEKEPEKETFSITTKGLARAKKHFIEIGDDISFHGDQLRLGKDSSLLITEKGLTSFITKNDLTFSNFYQHFDKDGIVFGGSEEASKLLAIKKDGVHLIVPNLFYDGNGGSNEAIIQYKKVTDGLDLFVV